MTKQSDKPAVAKDHPIQQIWEDNKKSHVELAREGDRDAIKAVLKQFEYSVHMSGKEWESGSYLVQTGEHYRLPLELVDYLLEVFSKITKDRDTPDTAFKWTSGKRGNPGKSHKERHKELRLALRVADLIDEFGNDNKKEAFEQAAEEFNVSKSKAIHAHEKYIIQVK
ncbi:MAG: hypothetical protein AB2795_20590 [Candidatus Thiodiazotropha endolucinida]